ncbi:hypothetical protein FB566_5154 [Stackebrandtia endophytica]|uniref:Uncharacterized protein n=1 Tax=Stackebrandtia endophytica TaxID=1496996 RepID=A0A543B3Y1_9ACTN|nr:hypothetical protein [Stackebrandtia endophytica]TQL79545.1 hypothetical protein FB566_5154 [Stackebrandtia endophytica]
MSQQPGDPASPESGHDSHEDHRQESQRDLTAAKETLDRVRREVPFRRALWGFRLYYIAMFSSLGTIIVGCFDGLDSAMLIVPIALPFALIGYLYGYMQNRNEYREFLAAASTKVWHARRDRKNQWQAAILRDAFMGRLE